MYYSSEHYSLQNVKELPDFIQFKTFPGTPLRHIFTAAGDDLLDLIAQLLSVSPLNRCNCHEALQAPYFRLATYFVVGLLGCNTVHIC
jgi:hypothetical protein